MPLFDDADILVLDNNLAHLGIKGARLTAEDIAGYLRAFLTVPYIVSLNKNPDVDFDLRYLVGDYATKTDFALNTNHLANPALWTGSHNDANDGFLPWYWPHLAGVPARRREQIAFVSDHLDDSIIDTLRFPPQALDFLSLHAKGALSPFAMAGSGNGDDGIPFDRLTFRDVFVARSRSLPDKTEREALNEEARAGNAHVREIISRVVAADIDLWIRRDVLGPQDALVDIPHLLMRMPFLLGMGAGDIERWNQAISEEREPFGLDEGIYRDHLAGARFQHDVWVSSPCFWWSNLKANDKLDEFFFDNREKEWADVVFCEDSSVFAQRSPSGGLAPSEFSAEFEGSWGRRYVMKFDGIRYAPRTRFAI